MRLTRKTAAGRIVINEAAFPQYAPEAIWNETSYFEPAIAVVEKLYNYEEAEGSEADV